MASRRHHARFHAAVLRYLFPPSPPHASSHQETADQSYEDACFQAPLPKYAEPIAEEKCSDHADDTVGMEAGKALLSRAQRKRLKLKKLKEEQSGAMPAKRFIGPSPPDDFEKKGRHEVVDCQSPCALLLQDHGTSEESRTLLNSEDREDVHDVRDDGLSTAPKDIHNNARGLGSEETEGHGEAETEPLSKAKRRRIAKKKFQDSLQRYPQTGSSFTAEMKGGGIIIKQMV